MKAKPDPQKAHKRLDKRTIPGIEINPATNLKLMRIPASRFPNPVEKVNKRLYSGRSKFRR